MSGRRPIDPDVWVTLSVIAALLIVGSLFVWISYWGLVG